MIIILKSEVLWILDLGVTYSTQNKTEDMMSNAMSWHDVQWICYSIDNAKPSHNLSTSHNPIQIQITIATQIPVTIEFPITITAPAQRHQSQSKHQPQRKNSNWSPLLHVQLGHTNPILDVASPTSEEVFWAPPTAKLRCSHRPEKYSGRSSQQNSGLLLDYSLVNYDRKRLAGDHCPKPSAGAILRTA